MFSFGINRNSTASITRYSHARKAVYTKRLRYYWDESHYEAAELIAKRFSRPEQFGELANPTQALAWPRSGTSTAPDSIPRALATACAELAFYLLKPESTRRRDVQMQMIGQSMETYFSEVADELPIHVRRLVAPFLRVGSKHSVELVP